MDHKPEWKGRINQKDEDGCTVLHVVAAAPYPGYLIKRKEQPQAGGCAVGWMTSGIREPTQSSTRITHPSWDRLTAKPYLERSITGRAGCLQEGWGTREGRMAGFHMLFPLQ